MHPNPRAPVEILLIVSGFGAVAFWLLTIPKLRRNWLWISGSMRTLSLLLILATPPLVALMLVDWWAQGLGSTKFQPPISLLPAAAFGAMVTLTPRPDRADAAACDQRAQRGYFCLSFTILGVLQLTSRLEHDPWWRWAAIVLYVVAAAFLVLAASARARTRARAILQRQRA
ncbi:MAG: hypothetical protein ACYCUX_01305 [Metallibacterium sp.]